MFSSNTETGITATYQDGDNTIDLVVGTLNQTTTGSAATLTTARTIGGTSFDGSANIAVALAATATALASARTIHGVSFDGTGNIDLSEVVADTVGAMFSSNTETGITATYQDADNTIDLVVATLNQDTTGTAATVTGAAQTAITSVGTLSSLTLGGDLSIPSTITHVGDSDTKLDFNQANTMRLIAGDTTAWIANASSMVINEDSADFDFRVESNGNANMLFVDGGNDSVGIGTGSPSDELHVKGGSSSAFIRIDNSADGHDTGINIYQNGSRKWEIHSDDSNTDALDFRPGGTQKFIMTQSGRFGVGTTSPDTGIEVSTSANITQTALTSSSSAVAWDAVAKANAYHVTTENTTFSAPSNAVEGAIISVELAQGGTARTIAWNTVFEFAASTAPTVTATASKTDIFSFRYNGSVWQEIGRVQNMAQT